MAYQEYGITSLSQVVPNAIEFARGVGWHVIGDDALQHPNYEGGGPGGLIFRLSYNESGLDRDLIWQCITAPYADRRAVLRSPILAFPEAPTVGVAQVPTRMFAISMLEPEPYLAIVIEYGYNLYRHLYLGFAEKIGNYRGGEIISASNGPIGASIASSSNWTSDASASFLFSAAQRQWAANASGGIHVDHADNANKWRHFRRAGIISSTMDLQSTFNAAEAIGGFSDSLNDGYVSKGKNPSAGANILVPINLCAPSPVTGDMRFIPLGSPAGVRMMHIEELEAQAVSEVGGETWYSFAAHRKSAGTSIISPQPTVSSYRYPHIECSYYLGYAYRGA